MNGRLTFEVEGDTQKALVKAIAELQEIFECDESCGRCKSQTIRLNIRTIESNGYYSFVCVSCGAELLLGQHKKGGTLFPKRVAANGEPLANRGWKRFRSDSPAAAPRPEQSKTDVRK